MPDECYVCGDDADEDVACTECGVDMCLNCHAEGDGRCDDCQEEN